MARFFPDMIIDSQLLDSLTEQAMASPRLWLPISGYVIVVYMNHNV